MVRSVTRLAGLLLLVAQVLLPFLGQAQTLTQADFTGLLVPQYMSSGTATRVPVAFRATVSNLTPNTLYRYYNQGAISTDLGGSNSGAGNPLLITPGATAAATTYVYTSSATTTTAGGYATFTSDVAGTYTGWFAFANTGNARFTAGNTVYPTIVLATDAAPATVAKRLALDQTLTVLALGTDAVGFKGSSAATPKNLVAVYGNEAGTGRPVGLTVVESIASTGATFTGPAYYTSAAGDWNTLIPSALSTGIRRVEQRSVLDGTVVGCASDADGTWPSGVNTVNPTAATTALALTATDAPLTTCGTASTAPTITSFTPTTGPIGSVVTVTGTNFTGATGATLNGTAGTGFMVMSATEVMFTVAAGSTTGAITVTTAGGTATSTTSFTVTTPTAAPTITSFTPATGAAGATVTLTGTNFTGATAVTLNGAAITGFTVVNATTITFAVPAGATSGTIAVTTPGGTITSSTSFTVSTPTSGNFFEDFELGAKGSYAAAPVTLTSGIWNFSDAVIGTSTADRFNGAKSARIRTAGFIEMSFDKPNGAGVVTINAALYGTDTGTSFTLAVSTDGGVTYNPVAGAPTALTSTLTAYSFTVNQPGNVRLRIANSTTVVGTTAAPRVNIDDITITDASAPTTATLTATPATLPAFTTVVGTPSAAQTFTISGTLLTADATITAPAGYEVSLTAGSGYASSITVTQASGSIANTTIYVRLIGTAVSTPAGNITVASMGATTQNVAVTGTVTATAPTTPTITSFTPATGAAGATVTLTGTNFTGATAVTLNGAAITGFTVVNATTITFAVPAGATSGTIAVTTPAGTATSTGTFTVGTTATTPTISTISPVRAVVGGPGFTMTLTGTNFTAATQVSIGTNTYTAATVNAGFTTITINVPASQIATLGQFQVTANNGGTASTPARDFFVVPAATSVAFEDFEQGTKSGYAVGTTPTTLRSGDWTFTDALIGDQFNDRVNQVKSARIRGGSIAMNFDKPNGAGDITLSAALYGTDATASFTLEISTDGGTTYTLVPGAPAGLTTTLTPYTFTVNRTGNVRLRIGSTNTTVGANPRINIDDLFITDFTGTATLPGKALPGLALYPNPAHDRLMVALPTAGAATVALRDLTGRVVLAEAALAADKVVALPVALAAGTYLLEVHQNGVTAVRRITKE